jgi:glucose-6-phosphate 1-epimerase
MINELNGKFGIRGHIAFDPGEGGLPRAVVRNALASAEVYLHGAHVTEFQPNGAPGGSVLWMSDIAQYRKGKAIRGGIPIVWPWFGPHPGDDNLPQHGFARVSQWSVAGTVAWQDGRTELRLRLCDDEATRSLWPHAFELELRVVVGTELQVELRSRNTGAEAIEIGGALHTYFHVGDVGRVSVEGFAGRDYIDRLDDDRVKPQEGSIAIAEEVDRVYLDTTDESVIADPVLNRRTHVAKKGSRTTVVWNPWVEKSKRMGDFPDDGYLSMVCIEATNTASDVYQVPPGGEHVLSQIIRSTPL